MIKLNGAPYKYRNEWEHRAVYHMTNRIHDGELWTAYRNESGDLRFTSGEVPPGGQLLGEIECVKTDDGYEFDIVPIKERDAVELALRAQRTEAHKAYRRELYRRYPIEERIRNLKNSG